MWCADLLVRLVINVARKLKSDKALFVATILLVCVSVVMVYSASAHLGRDLHDDPYYFLIRQGLWAMLGVAIMAVAMRIDYRTYKNEALIWTVLAAVAMLLVAVLVFGDEVNGARRWIGFKILRFQPSELAKIACILFAALMLDRRMHRINEISYSLLPIGIVTVAIAGLIAVEPDAGTAMSLLLVVGIMVFSTGLSYRYIAGVALVAIPTVLVYVLSADYRRDRLRAWLDPWAFRRDEGFQIIQSFLAIGSGGVFGVGLTEGLQKRFYLPEPHNDFIYAVVGEELGLIGTTAVLLCFGVIVWRGLQVALKAEDRFGSLVALGITMMIAVQAFVNISVVLGLLPTKGIPLPLMSSGGSSLVVSLLAIGILLNISQHESADA